MPDNERIARLETQLENVIENFGKMEVSLEALVQGVNSIQLMLANESGKRTMLRYVGHGATILLGGLAGLLGAAAHPVETLSHPVDIITSHLGTHDR